MAESKKSLLQGEQEKTGDKQSSGEHGEEYQKIWYRKWDNEQLIKYFLSQLEPLKLDEGIQAVAAQDLKRKNITYHLL